MTERKNTKIGLQPRQRSRRGNAIVEYALCFLPFMFLLLGTIDYSLAIFKRNTFQNAVREGVRYAITGQIMGAVGSCTQDSSIKSVVQTNSMGLITDTNMIKIQYYAEDPVTHVIAPTMSNAGGNIVSISIQGYNHSWIFPYLAGYGSTTLPLLASSSDIVETSAIGGAPCR